MLIIYAIIMPKVKRLPFFAWAASFFILISQGSVLQQVYFGAAAQRVLLWSEKTLPVM